MRTLLFTGYDDKMAPLGDLTAPLMEQYAKRHGMDFKVIKYVPEGIYWVGVVGALAALKSYQGWDQVIYLDADQKITNPDVLIDSNIIMRFHCSRDWGVDAKEFDFSMCGFVAHRDCIPLLDEALRIEPEWRDKPFPEQGPMRHISQTYSPKDLPSAVVVHPRRTFNAVPIQVHPSVVDPWQPGDWCAHLTMLELGERIKLFHQING